MNLKERADLINTVGSALSRRIASREILPVGKKMTGFCRDEEGI
jgi:hypothetical protein